MSIPAIKTSPANHLQQAVSIVNPSYNAHQIRRLDYEENNDSQTDFAYALALSRRGVSEKEIAERIRRERIRWDNHTGKTRKQHYLDKTAAKAAKIIQATSLY